MEIKDEETYPFICPDCKGMYECDLSIDGLCVCCECEKEIYYKFHIEGKMVELTQQEVEYGTSNRDR